MALRSIVLWGVLIVSQNVNCDSGAAEYCYNVTRDCGPSMWPGDCTTRFNDSPVNFASFSDGFKNPTMTNLSLSEDCSKPQPFTLKNDGSKVLMELKKPCYMSGGLFRNALYNCSLIVLHYGSYYEGSEHKFKGYSKAMEGQIVCIKSEYDSLFEALKSGVGAVHVFAVIFYDSSSTTNDAVKPLINTIGKIKNPKTEAEGSGFVVSKFIMDQGRRRDYCDVASYRGSLTYPVGDKCWNGRVIWLIKTRFIAMTRSQMNEIRNANVTDSWETPMTENRRQPATNGTYDGKIEHFRITLPKEDSSSGNMIPPFPKIPNQKLPST